MSDIGFLKYGEADSEHSSSFVSLKTYLKPRPILCMYGAMLNSELRKILYFVQVYLSDMVIKASEQHIRY